jgi:hypothetical protein
MVTSSHKPQDGTVQERRTHRRLDIRLPVECSRDGSGSRTRVRTITRNIGSGGLYLEVDGPDFDVGEQLRLELTIPPAEGVSTTQGKAITIAKVLRVTPGDPASPGCVRRFGVAAQFLHRLRLSC